MKNLVVARKIFLARLYVGISQDSITSTQEKKDALGMRVQDAWNNKWPRTIAEWTARNLETKWGSIKHDVSELHEIYVIVKALKVSEMSEKDVTHDLLHMYQLKHLNWFGFGFEHCWHILKEVPRRLAVCNDSAKTPESLKKKNGCIGWIRGFGWGERGCGAYVARWACVLASNYTTNSSAAGCQEG